MLLPPEAAGNSEVLAHAIEATVLGVLLAVGRWLNKREGEKKDTATAESRESIRVSLDSLTGTVEGIRDEMRDLKGHVIGPDGQNGLRGDVRELKEDVRGLLDRERPPMISRRSSP